MTILRLGFLLTLGAFCTGGILSLRQQTASPSPAAPATAPGKDSTPEARRSRPRGFVGEVVAVTSADGTFTARETLNDGSPKTTKFQTTAQTRITCGKESCTLADVKVNDHVTVKYADLAGGEKKALTVRITPVAKTKTAR